MRLSTGFDAYMEDVDAALADLTGGVIFSHMDLADWHYWDRYNDGVPAAETAEEILEEEGFPV